MADLLAAGWDAFEVIIAASGDGADSGDGFFTPVVYALAAAADGRDAVTTAPSLPVRRGAASSTTRVDPGPTVRSAAAEMAALCEQLAVRLVAAARTAGDPGDQAACLIAARYAREIHALLAGARA
ncbi:MAG: hypothetical protein ACRDRJ_09780 [Streptosporangiaceae bacterium]